MKFSETMNSLKPMAYSLWRPFRRGRKGQTMIEVVVATVIAAITTVAIFSVILSGMVSQKKAEKKEQVAMTLKNAQQTLQAFVSADVTNLVDPAVPGVYYAPSTTPGGLWAADTSGRWALDRGGHDITSLIRGTPLCTGTPACSFTYVVADNNSAICVDGILGTGTNKACKTVFFTMIVAD